jgi:hypothetical protein
LLQQYPNTYLKGGSNRRVRENMAFFLRGDEKNIDGHKKKRDIGELQEQQTSIAVLDTTVLRG